MVIVDNHETILNFETILSMGDVSIELPGCKWHQTCCFRSTLAPIQIVNCSGSCPTPMSVTLIVVVLISINHGNVTRRKLRVITAGS